MKIKNFLLKCKNKEKEIFIWNTVGTLLMGTQSVLMLFPITRILGLEAAGIFTIAFANANLFMMIGKYGMRYFQVSDINNQFSFAEYRASRVSTTLLMIAVSVVYVIYVSKVNGYTHEKTWIILWMCIYKAVDVIEDVYLGYYQKWDRLDVAAKGLAIRMILTVLFFDLGIIVLKDLLMTTIITTIFSSLILLIFIKMTIGYFKEEYNSVNKKNIMRLLVICFPLFVGVFLSYYIGNAPKYAIDAIMTDELQACYGFISMPVFIIGLLNSFIFNPILYKMTMYWEEGNINQFLQRTIKQIGIVICITLVCVIGAYVVGIPGLSWLYNTNLTPYKSELILLLIGGGLLGISGLLNAVITIMRMQHGLMCGYLIVACMAFLFSNGAVQKYGMLGAALLYLFLMTGLCLIFMLIFICGIIKRRYQSRNN